MCRPPHWIHDPEAGLPFWCSEPRCAAPQHEPPHHVRLDYGRAYEEQALWMLAVTFPWENAARLSAPPSEPSEFLALPTDLQRLIVLALDAPTRPDTIFCEWAASVPVCRTPISVLDSVKIRKIRTPHAPKPLQLPRTPRVFPPSARAVLHERSKPDTRPRAKHEMRYALGGSSRHESRRAPKRR